MRSNKYIGLMPYSLGAVMLESIPVALKKGNKSSNEKKLMKKL